MGVWGLKFWGFCRVESLKLCLIACHGAGFQGFFAVLLLKVWGFRAQVFGTCTLGFLVLGGEGRSGSLQEFRCVRALSLSLPLYTYLSIYIYI